MATTGNVWRCTPCGPHDVVVTTTSPRTNPVVVPSRARDEALRFLSSAQSDPAGAVAHLGSRIADLPAALDALPTPWLDTLRVVRADDRLVGAALSTYDRLSGRVRAYGPWTDDNAWASLARPLLEAVLALAPTASEEELCVPLPHTRLAGLAEDAGFAAGPLNHTYTLDRAASGALDADTTRVRRSRPSDLDFIRDLHTLEFPGRYNSAAGLAHCKGCFTLVLEDAAGEPVGYASGRARTPRNGVIEFMAVAPDARGRGDGHRRRAAAGRELFAAGDLQEVCLVVEDRRRPAVRFYEASGFVRTESTRVYRRARPTA